MTIHKLCIFGTRTFYDNPEAARIIETELEELQPEMIITAGDADGVCRLAIDKAREFSIPCEIHFLNQKKHARGMYHYRSQAILERSDFVLFIHDGKSHGTLNDIEQAKTLKLKTKYYKIQPRPDSFAGVPDMESLYGTHTQTDKTENPERRAQSGPYKQKRTPAGSR